MNSRHGFLFPSKIWCHGLNQHETRLVHVQLLANAYGPDNLQPWIQSRIAP
jgi:hypothetical protein